MLVFISYSHQDEVWKNRLVEQINNQNKEVQIEIWHDRQIMPGSEWFIKIETAMNTASIAVILISPHFLKSNFCLQYEVGPLLARREKYGLIILPVLIAPCAWETIHWLKPIQMLPRDGKTVIVDYKGSEDEILEDVARHILKILDEPGYKPSNATIRVKRPEAVNLNRLTYTGFDLVGRDANIAHLNLALRNYDTRLIVLSGNGGVGKTSLVNKWLEGIDNGIFEGTSKVFAWSFAGDIGPEQEPSSEPFIHSALEWFGDSNPKIGSPWDKAERLAKLIDAERTILVLDGIEIFQSTMPSLYGEVKDPALSTLLFELSIRNQGLCIVTSRMPLNELNPFLNTVAFVNLECLSDIAGRALLRLAGVRGIDEKLLEQASHTLNGNALAIKLLASYLLIKSENTRERLNEILEIPFIEEGGEVPILLQRITERMENIASNELISLVSILDGVADKNLLDRFRLEPVIAGLNVYTHAMDDNEWQQLVRNLRRLNLLFPGDERTPERLTTHPLITRYFNEQLRKLFPDAWIAAHNRLYDYYKTQILTAPKTITQAIPALRAVYHSACAGDFNNALNLFYQIDHRDQHRVTDINAPSMVLSALRPFYEEEGWVPLPVLESKNEAYLVNITGALLRSLGRLEDAIKLFTYALEARKSQNDWLNASKNAMNISELTLIAGHIGLSWDLAEESVNLAFKSGNYGAIIYCLTTYGDLLHHADKLEDARVVFEQAEVLHRDMIASKGFPINILYRLPGIRYCEYLLTIGNTKEVLKRVSVLSSSGPDISQEEMALGFAIIAEAIRLDQGSSHITVFGGNRINAIGYADLALNSLRISNSELYEPKLLLIRARNYAVIHELEKSSDDIERALVISKRNHSELFKIDALIEKVRIEIARGYIDNAIKIINEIRTNSEQTGYGRAIRELHVLERSLNLQ